MTNDWSGLINPLIVLALGSIVKAGWSAATAFTALKVEVQNQGREIQEHKAIDASFHDWVRERVA